MDVIAGKNFLVYITGTGDIGQTTESYPIGCDKTCSIVISVDMLETTSKDNGPYRTSLPTLVSYQITGDGLVDYSKTMGVQSLQQLCNTRKLISFKFESSEIDSQRAIYSGVGYFQQVQMSGPAEGDASFSYAIQVTGKLEIDNTFIVEGGDGQNNDTVAQVYSLYFRTTTDQTSYQNDVLVGATLLLLSIEQVILFKDDSLGPTGETHWTAFDSATGTASWNFDTFNKSRGYILYKK